MKVTAGIFLIRRDGKLLVAHPTNHLPNFWSIPKGGVDEGETLFDAALRETYEETNVNLEKLNCQNHKVYKLEAVKYKKKDKTLNAYVFFEAENDCDFSKFEFKCNSFFDLKGISTPEMDDYKWVTLDEAEHLVHESQVRCLAQIRPLLKNI